MPKDKRDLSDKIENLFTEMGSEQPADAQVTPGKLNGWTWECDAEAYYTSCSPEVVDFLGVSARRFTGKSLYSYRLHPRSILLVRRGLQEEIYPQELSVHFEGENGTWVLVRMHITRKVDKDDKVTGWGGFNLLIRRYKPGELERELGEDYGFSQPDPAPGSRPKPTFRPPGPPALNDKKGQPAAQEPPSKPRPPAPPSVPAEDEHEGLLPHDAEVMHAGEPTDLPGFLIGREPAPAPTAGLTPNRIRFRSGKYTYETMERLPYPTKEEQYLTYVPIANQPKKKQTILLEVLFVLMILALVGLLVAFLLGAFK